MFQSCSEGGESAAVSSYGSGMGGPKIYIFNTFLGLRTTQLFKCWSGNSCWHFLYKSLISYSVFSIALINRMNYTNLASGNSCLQICTCTCEHFPFRFLFPLISSSVRHIFVHSCCMYSCAGSIAAHTISEQHSGHESTWVLHYVFHLQEHTMCVCAVLATAISHCLNLCKHDQTQLWLHR